jgi:hypothetical protein
MTPEALSEASASDGPGYAWTPRWLRRARGRANSRRSLVVAGGLLGLSLAWVHWLGLVAGGALVGLASRSVRGAVAAGLGFGSLVLAVHVLASPVVGPGTFVGLTPISFVSVAAALVAPVWGALGRALV